MRGRDYNAVTLVKEWNILIMLTDCDFFSK